ncbi:TadE/TadG family type IV pilus assembly protein [Mesorhizobium qingshengii]|uniref:Flp pilus assembly protein TadG n=1 Tax=Mesorhizobium qingshengii TaxID=1165689 RepID=A0A1G5ZGF8_9HYPH|nr:TadE/TadG family type IV pilus assembly protein [Mesorhizobium qingshengii]SDA93979.1 Flp pilus assembly protein TadG [Mesorhizobium qingshengii]
MFIALRQFIRRFHGDEQGAALVETAIAAPFVLLLSAGVFEFSNILNTRLLLEAGVEDGARYMARCNDSSWANCVLYGTNLAVNGSITGGSARVPNWTTPQVTVTVSHTAAVDAATGTELYLSSTANVDVVKVSTSVPYNGIGLWGYLGFGTLNITASHQERVFGW